jgi:hypothetical protein
MARDRSRYGALASALGAILLAVSVFLPWYGVGLSARGVEYFGQIGAQLAQRFGNATLQAKVAEARPQLSALAGRELASVSANQIFSHIGPILLILAGIGILVALVPLVLADGSEFDAAGPWLALLGALAACLVLYRMAVRPSSTNGLQYLQLSLREGAWGALLGSSAMVVGGLWPRRLRARGVDASPADLEETWSGLSGWTPGS